MCIDRSVILPSADSLSTSSPQQLCDELVGAFQELDGDSSVGAIVLTGHGKAFAGAYYYCLLDPLTPMFSQVRLW